MSMNHTAMGTIMLQNGVGNGAGLSSPQIPLGSSRDSINGNVGESPKRPNKLPVFKPKVCVTKAIQENSEDINGGSLPSSPETHSVDGLEESGRPAALDSDTRQLLSRFLADFTGLSKAQWKESTALTTMKRVVGDLMEKHRYVFNGRWPGFVWRRYKEAALRRGEPLQRVRKQTFTFLTWL